MHVEGSILVNSSAERVWSLVTDPRLSPRWNPNLTEVRDLSESPLKVGSSWVQVVKILGVLTEMKATVLDYRPPEVGTVSFSGPGAPRVSTLISPENGSVRLAQTMDFTDVSGIAGMALRLARHTIEHDLNEALLRQKLAAEADDAKS